LSSACATRARQQVLSAVFAEKDLGRDKPIAADFVGLRLPNRYVFGYGMDVKGAWRNLPAVYAVKGM
jgi:hypoxanthine phosphoribosyltransferase